MKKYIILILAIAMLSSSCKKTLVGSGWVITQNRTIDNFTSVSANGDMELTLRKGPLSTISITGEDNVIEKLATDVRGGKLVIKYKDGINVHDHDRLSLTVTVPSLSSVQLNGSGKIIAEQLWETSNFTAELNGSGYIVASSKSESVHGVVNGSGSIEIGGSSDHSALDIKGSGKLFSFQLSSKQSDANIEGSGKIELSTSEKLNASITGSGKIFYKGNPQVFSNVHGSGSILQAN